MACDFVISVGRVIKEAGVKIIINEKITTIIH